MSEAAGSVAGFCGKLPIRSDFVTRRVPLSVRVEALSGQPLGILVRDDVGHEVRVTWDQPLQPAEKHPLTAYLIRQQFGRLGVTTFELGAV